MNSKHVPITKVLYAVFGGAELMEMMGNVSLVQDPEPRPHFLSRNASSPPQTPRFSFMNRVRLFAKHSVIVFSLVNFLLFS